MKTVWKGSLSFGLVNIPVELYSAIQEHSLGFKLLHKKCQTPINYQRWCANCNKMVEWHDIVKGIKLSNGSYFILTQEHAHALRAHKTDTIDVLEFVDATALEPLYLEHHYYVVPAKTNERAYFLFVEALKAVHKVAIGQFVLRDKEYVCVVQPYQQGLLLSTLNYLYEVRELKKFNELEAPKLDARELKLAEQLINKLSKKKLDMSQFKDRFAEEIKTELKKTQAKPVKAAAKKRVGKTTTPTLLQTLQESVRGVGAETRA